MPEHNKRQPSSSQEAAVSSARTSLPLVERRALRKELEQMRAWSSLREELMELTSRRDMIQVGLNHLVVLGCRGALGLLYVERLGELQPIRTAFESTTQDPSSALPYARCNFSLTHQENLSVRALRTREVLCAGSIHEILRPNLDGPQSAEYARELKAARVIAIPLWIRDRPYGVLAAWYGEEAREPDLSSLRTFRRILEKTLVRAQMAYELEAERQRSVKIRQAYLALFNTSVDPIFVVDPVDGGFLRVNERACAFLHYEERDLLMKSLLDVKIGMGPDSAAQVIYRAVEQEVVKLDDVAFRRKDGRVAFGHLTARFVRDEAELLAPSCPEGVLLFMVRDTTEHRAARSAIQSAYDRLSAYVEDLKRKNLEVARERERVEQANRLKSEFLANMSHELRTPMNAIIGFTSRVLKTGEERLSARENRNLNIVLRNAEQLLLMINDLLDFSRLEAGRMEIKPERFDVYDMIDECAEVASQTTRDKDVEWKIECAQDLTLESDRGKVRQILLNLMSNAGKFTEKGTITITARRSQDDSEDLPMLAIEVADTGLGIRQDHLDMIFEAFRQVDGSYTRREGGTGLGLAISSRLASLLGGYLSVSSTFGEGSTFVFHCPFEPPRRIVERGQRLGA